MSSPSAPAIGSTDPPKSPIFGAFADSPDPVLVTTSSGLIAYVNTAWEKFTGYSFAEVSDQPISFLHPDKTALELQRRVLSTLAKGQSLSVAALPGYRKNGATYYANVTYYPMYVQGDHLYYVHIERPVLDLEQPTDASPQQQRYKSFIEKASDGIVLFTKQRTVIDTNQQISDILGYTKAEMVGKNLSDFMVAEDTTLTADTMNKLGSGENTTTNRIIRRKDGRIVPVEAHTTSIDNNTFQTIIRDVSEQLKARQELLENIIRYQDMFAFASDGFLLFTPQMEIVDVNNRFCELTGYTKQELLAMPITGLLLPKDMTEAAVAIRLLEQGELLQSDRTILRKDGAHIIIEASSRMVHFNLFKAIIRDVTVQRRNEVKIRSLNLQVNRILNSISDSFFSLDTKWRFTFINKNAKRMFPVRPASFIGKSIWKVYPGLIGTKLEETYREAMEHQSNAEITITSFSGRSFRIHCYPSREGLSIYFTDITMQENISKRQRAFMGVASHELKTPLTSITLNSQLLSKHLAQSPDSRALVFAQKLETQIHRFGQLTENLLDISSIETGNLTLSREPFSLSKLLIELIAQTQPLSKQHHIATEGFTDQQVLADRTKISQVINNLLNNALKYSPEADTVLVRMKSDKELVTVSIQDFGIGMPPDQMLKVFEDYYRASSGKQAASGLGLGLYISRTIIDAHEGKIWVESKVGQGSTFSFTLPLHIN